MAATEVIVIAGGLVLGYWLVAVLIPNLSARQQASANAPAPGHSEGDRFGPDSTRSDCPARQDAPQGHRPWFEVLEVSEFASREDVVAAYKKKIRQYHPDKVASMGDEIRRIAEERSKEINAAYQEATGK